MTNDEVDERENNHELFSMLGSVTPYLSIHHHDVEEWLGKDVHMLCGLLERMRVNVRDAVGYNCDNEHCRIRNSFKKEVIIIGSHYDEDTPEHSHIAFWNAQTGDSLDVEWSGKVTKSNVEWLKTAVKSISDGKRLCNECGAWVDAGIVYSFAGFVCNKCYNPKKHLPPDTRGD